MAGRAGPGCGVAGAESAGAVEGILRGTERVAGWQDYRAALLAADAVRPWRHRSWIFSRDPHVALNASRVLDLCQREWRGKPLSADDYVRRAPSSSA